MDNFTKEQWYIATTITGSEDKIKDELMEKIIAYKFQNEVLEMKIIKQRLITIEEFNDTNNPPPKVMRNSKNIEWRTIPKGYEKTTVKETNCFPGYLFINMIMTQEVWYIIRNTAGITGFVGSSGKGTKPIPISEYELDGIFNKDLNKDKIIRISGKTITEDVILAPIENKSEEKISNVEYFDSKAEISRHPFIIDPKITTDTEEVLGRTMNEENKDEYIDGLKNNENFSIGNEVTIINGTLIGSTGVVRKVDLEKKTLILDVEILGTINQLELIWKDVVK